MYYSRKERIKFAYSIILITGLLLVFFSSAIQLKDFTKIIPCKKISSMEDLLEQDSIGSSVASAIFLKEWLEVNSYNLSEMTFFLKGYSPFGKRDGVHLKSVSYPYLMFLFPAQIVLVRDNRPSKKHNMTEAEFMLNKETWVRIRQKVVEYRDYSDRWGRYRFHIVVDRSCAKKDKAWGLYTYFDGEIMHILGGVVDCFRE